MLCELGREAVAIGALGLERDFDLLEAGAAVGDRVDQPGDRGVGQLNLARRSFSRADLGSPLALHAEVKLLRHQLDRRGRQQRLLKTLEHARLELAAIDAPTDRARPRFAMPTAAPAASIDGGVVAAAVVAPDEPRQEMAWPLPIGEGDGRALAAALLGADPQIMIDDAQLGDLDRAPIGDIVEPRDALSAFRVEPHLHAVVDEAAIIDRVVQDADLAAGMTDYRRGTPFAALGRGHAFGIEPQRDRPGTMPIDIFAEDPAHDGGLALLDGPQAAVDTAVGAQHRRRPIAVAQPARDLAALDRGGLAASDLVRELLELERVHRALQADVQLVDVALGEGDQPDIGEFEILEDRRDVGLVAGDAIQRLGQDDVEAASGGIAQHRGHAGPPVGCAGDGEIGVGVDDFPAFARGALPADADLVLGRSGILAVG